MNLLPYGYANKRIGITPVKQLRFQTFDFTYNMLENSSLRQFKYKQ